MANLTSLTTTVQKTEYLLSGVETAADLQRLLDKIIDEYGRNRLHECQIELLSGGPEESIRARLEEHVSRR